jgi:8-oxo-dGTP pyrophosphatase MutT (NUDIX family)
MPKKDKKGAGFLVFRDFADGRKVLVLLSASGKFDIPKGHVDAADLDRFGTAQRECFEETQIFITMSDLLTRDEYHDKRLTIFCALTNQDPVLAANPESGKLEHTDFYWLSPDSARKILPKYLSRALQWGLKHTE